MQDAVNYRLTQLAAMPVPATLDALEADVFATIEKNARSRMTSRTIGAWSVGAALALGLFGGISLGSGATPAQAASPIGIDAALAPSTLLGR
ncbi:hypothetical protein ASF00_05250 [Sphingomonas sp. Leaf34]|jgi:hypothetical protein|uniref:hypothetical protein n=1 Tax=Sphingomonas sp. Leaf34 TaxID=1736216 RepID=UPI0006F9C161|nr:hypothetical protein [Sphingomonas sp. Leaf34]KQN32138.1 hypothetical protein ASF00_05250 [Sphingomonas sp. Leaf34]